MVTVDLYDELEVKRLPVDRFSRYAILWHSDARRRSDINWSVTRDLAVRAHLALERHLHRRLPVQMKLEKRIPVGGGLGGGSSDAAAMLHAVNHLYGLELSVEELAAVGATLGADVPFLVRGGSAIVEGRGEQVEHHAALPELSAVLVLAEASCPTAEVYRRFDETPTEALKSQAIRDLPGERASGILSERIFNDLASAAMLVSPELETWMEKVAAIAERRASVSGSGSTLFTLCDDPLHAEFLAGTVERELGLPALAVRTVPGHRIAEEPERMRMRGIPE
jgi:4-diphosphocytidyl-2-C-methyl-D-erythritol kinase